MHKESKLNIYKNFVKLTITPTFENTMNAVEKLVDLIAETWKINEEEI